MVLPAKVPSADIHEIKLLATGERRPDIPTGSDQVHVGHDAEDLNVHRDREVNVDGVVLLSGGAVDLRLNHL